MSGITLSMSTSWYGFEEERDTMSTATRPVSAVAASMPNFFSSIFIIFRIGAESIVLCRIVISQSNCKI